MLRMTSRYSLPIHPRFVEGRKKRCRERCSEREREKEREREREREKERRHNLLQVRLGAVAGTVRTQKSYLAPCNVVYIREAPGRGPISLAFSQSEKMVPESKNACAERTILFWE
jgi:hypothetical protein